MGKWLDLAARLEAEAGSGDNRDNRDEMPSNVPNVPNVPASLPPDVRAGLATLRAMAAPAITRPEVWPEIVADALRLASEGYAQQAFGLGWEPIQLFGWSPDREGVAVWLAGGVPMFTVDACTVRISAGKFRCMDRRPILGAVFLWDLGRVAHGQTS